MRWEGLAVSWCAVGGRAVSMGVLFPEMVGGR